MKTISQKRIEANRRNARKSTGPKTQAGKAAAKLNALKYGIFSREVVVQGWKIHESHEEFDSLRQEFWNHYAPVGPVEEMLVDWIVTVTWRLRRVMTAESGEIALNVDDGHWHRTKPGIPELNVKMAAQFPMLDSALSMEESVLGLDLLCHMLGRVRSIVEKEGELTDAALLETHIAGKPNSLTSRLAEFRKLSFEKGDGLDEAALKTKRREQILHDIDLMIFNYSCKKVKAIERETAEESARQAAAILPSADILEKILRYVTPLERQLYRAMHELERLQRLRQGEAVPPPLTMEVSAR